MGTKTFEICVILRNAKGEAIMDAYGNPKKKSYASDSAYKIWEFWNQNGFRSRKSTGGKASANAEKILNYVNSSFAKEVIKKKRRSFDDGEKA